MTRVSEAGRGGRAEACRTRGDLRAKGRAGVRGIGLLLLGGCVATRLSAQEPFDWRRDAVERKDGKELRGVVIEACDPERVVLLADGNRRTEVPLAEVQRVDKLRDRLASFLGVRREGLSVASEWQLVTDAELVRLPLMARLQALRVLLLDPEHAAAHEYLGHRRAGGGWAWPIDGKNVSEKRFAALSREWNSRLVLESEHFVVESDAGLPRALEVLFDLEGLYVWWMANLGQELRAAEDVDDPRAEKITFLVHQDLASFQPLSRKEPYYDPSGMETTSKGGINVARTFYTPGSGRPEQLFELGAQSLIYSTLVLGKTKGREPTPEIARSAYWVEVGLAYWVARHAGGPPGFPRFQAPFEGGFQVDFETALRTFDPIGGGHPLTRGRSELTNLSGLSYDNFVGNSANIPLCKARCGTFVAFLIEADPEVKRGKKTVAHGREALWHYLREVYGTPTAQSSSAFDDGLGGARIETLEAPWKAWVKPFTSLVGPPPGAAPTTR